MKTITTNLAFVFFLTGFWAFSQSRTVTQENISHSFYVTGNLMTENDIEHSTIINALVSQLQNDDKPNTILFLGNNIPKGGTMEDGPFSHHILAALKPYSHNMYFIPGELDWKQGLKGLKKQEDFLEGIFQNRSIFQPEKGCPIEKIEINEHLDLLILDSQWALSDWNIIPNINDHCEIKNKLEFYIEVEHEIVKSQDKTVLVALHHPVSNYGKYSNQLNFGINPKNINNKHYKEFSDHLLTIAQQFKNVVFVSALEQNLQLIDDNEVPIIISGAVANNHKAKNGYGSKFYYNDKGFSKIIVLKDGSIWATFYGEQNNFEAPLFSKEIVESKSVKINEVFDEYNTPRYVNASIYEPEELERSGFYKTLWGEHFRDDYKQKIKVKTVLLDTLYGGLSVVRKGGGHQTNSLRLMTRDNKEFVMRSAKKSALRFLQYFLFKTQYLEPDVEDDYFVQLLQDYWTTAHPYGQLTIAELSDAIGLYHANTELYYVPKQQALGIYNDAYGGKIYFIEERLTDGHENIASLGNTNKIESTKDLFDKLRRKDKIEVNEALYIRTRLFDNIIGDWDRHEDQWRWAVQQQANGIELYEPIARDRDQVYSDFDGFILGALTTLSPPLRFMQRYDASFNHTKWYNDAGDDVDLTVLMKHTKEDWIREAKYIQSHLTQDVIEKAFKKLPAEIDQEKVQRTKQALIGRLNNIDQYALDLYENLRENVIVTGSDKKDHFQITRKPNGITNVSIYRVKNGKKANKYWDVDYDRTVTKEIWIYGLDDEDVFNVDGKGDNYIRIKIIGGQNKDTYKITNRSNVRVFDQKTKPNKFETKVSRTLSDDYDLNTYYFKKNRRDISQIVPLIGLNPDDGLGIGAKYSYTKNALRRNPFTAKHDVSAVYYDATSGVQVNYSGEFATIFDKINLGIIAEFNSPSFTSNFFGFGNETENFDGTLDFDFNRVRIRSILFSPSLIYRGYQGSKTTIGLSYENVEVERTSGRFIETANVNQEVFNGQDFFGIEASYGYKNFDNETYPKSGFEFNLEGGYKVNFTENRDFFYVIPALRLTSKLDRKGILIYATEVKAHFNLGNEFEFYQAATLGDSNGLRGFRQERFSGNRSFYHSSDLRLGLGKFRNAILPISFGIYGGLDYGRVWVENDSSHRWHTTPGGGLFFNLAGFTTANVAYFSSKDGGRLNIALSLAF
ncbi:MAG: ShlB/FhaC/HecB family hemolysin secretion/activation protein [Allomuricauda sp.]